MVANSLFVLACRDPIARTGVQQKMMKSADSSTVRHYMLAIGTSSHRTDAKTRPTTILKPRRNVMSTPTRKLIGFAEPQVVIVLITLVM